MTKIPRGLHLSTALSNEEYHSENEHFSSSQIKDAVLDIELFFKKYIAGEIIETSAPTPAMLIGTYLHTAILEPQQLDAECCVFSGKRSGKAWTDFKEANLNKTILTSSEYEKAELLINAAKGSPCLMELLQGGMAELSLFHALHGLPLKVRADYINLEEGYILDLKTTSKNAKDAYQIQSTVSDFNYDLSAAMYLDLFNAYLKADGKPPIKTFYWGFVSKSCANAKVWEASPKMLQLGRNKFMNGVNQIHKYKDLKWTFPDEVSTIDPVAWEADKWLSGEKAEVKKHQKPKNIRKKKRSDLL